MDNFFKESFTVLIKEMLKERNVTVFDDMPNNEFVDEALALFKSKVDVYENILVLSAKLPYKNLGMLFGGATHFNIPVVLLDFDNIKEASTNFFSVSDCVQTTILYELAHSLQILEATYCDENNPILDIEKYEDWADEFANKLFYTNSINDDVLKLIELFKSECQRTTSV